MLHHTSREYCTQLVVASTFFNTRYLHTTLSQIGQVVSQYTARIADAWFLASCIDSYTPQKNIFEVKKHNPNTTLPLMCYIAYIYHPSIL